jgi:AcrR family transcriptional regulator
VETDRVGHAPGRAADGRVPGRRGQATRQRLLDTLRDLLETTSYRDIKVVDIAKAAGTSPATFYQYFAHVEGAVLALAESLADAGGRELRDLVTAGTWDNDDEALAAARHVADGYLSFWERHRALINVLDLGALEGDHRFRDLRTRLLNPALLELEDVVAAAVADGRLGAATDPRAVAVVLSAMLSHVAAHRPGLEDWGVSPDHLLTSLAQVISWSAVGAPHSAANT